MKLEIIFTQEEVARIIRDHVKSECGINEPLDVTFELNGERYIIVTNAPKKPAEPIDWTRVTE